LGTGKPIADPSLRISSGLDFKTFAILSVDTSPQFLHKKACRPSGKWDKGKAALGTFRPLAKVMEGVIASKPAVANVADFKNSFLVSVIVSGISAFEFIKELE
jgi:hypothetical protein